MALSLPESDTEAVKQKASGDEDGSSIILSSMEMPGKPAG